MMKEVKKFLGSKTGIIFLSVISNYFTKEQMKTKMPNRKNITNKNK